VGTRGACASNCQHGSTAKEWGILRSYREISLWKDVSPDEWSDWRWQFRNRLRNADDLARVINLTHREKQALTNGSLKLPVAVTPYLATLADPDDPTCPIRRQVIPWPEELDVSENDEWDPLSEEKQSPVANITHRYEDRVLFIVTEMCHTYCRHCTRRRIVGFEEKAISQGEVDEAVDYIRRHPVIRDVLVSGGDPLALGNEKLECILTELRRIPHVEVIRIGTRAPGSNPFRVTPELVEMLRKYHPLWINLQFNHPREITPEVRVACARLADAGFPLGNQTVLLRGINDSVGVQKKLVHELVKMRVRPYYLYQCDLSPGISHFRTPVATGIEIMENLRGHTSGYAVPAYVVDAPGGGGKIPLSPEYLISQSPREVIMRNYKGEIYRYPEPLN